MLQKGIWIPSERNGKLNVMFHPPQWDKVYIIQSKLHPVKT